MKTILVATFALIKNSENQILILKRAKRDTFPGRWELPGGGMDSGERPEESIEREVLEETGLIVKALRPLSVITHENHDATADIVRITYECDLIDDEKVILTKDHEDYRWVDLNKINLIDTKDSESPLNYILKDIEAKEAYLTNPLNSSN